ncbi:MAG: NAD(P)H-dependent oxidoreductase subunit E [Candidatus Moranbacteria bacterium]|nr:NAD(P)H-dependent oxidoreductase subunit E [Candidatus Moranbacteria bacterium]
MTVEKILLEFDPEQKNLLPALKKINAAFGYVGEEEARKAADYFSVPFSKVYETASFYDLVKTKKQPNLVIQVCSGANCAVKNSFKVIREIESQLRIKAGDDFNPKVKLEIISCLGQCGQGPVMVVNGNVFARVTPSSVDDILRNYI